MSTNYKVTGGRGDCLVITFEGASEVHKKEYIDLDRHQR